MKEISTQLTLNRRGQWGHIIKAYVHQIRREERIRCAQRLDELIDMMGEDEAARKMLLTIQGMIIRGDD